MICSAEIALPSSYGDLFELRYHQRVKVYQVNVRRLK
jgi:hypothetical protein